MKKFLPILLFSFLMLPVTAMGDDLLELLGNEEVKTQEGTIHPRAALMGRLLTSRTAEQNIFTQFFKDGNYKKALYQWPVAFEGSTFESTDNGRALYGVLLFKNGLEVLGLETIMTVSEPKSLDKDLVSMVREMAPETHDSWTLVKSMWNPQWTEILGVATEIRVRSRNLFDPEKVVEIEDLIKKTSLSSWERAWVEWQLVLSLSLKGDIGKAAKVLAHLMKAENNPIGKDLMTITASRLLYQNGYLDPSIRYYQQVSKSSDYWFEAQEEMGWAYIRKGQPQNTLALMKTIMIPEFSGFVGPESVFLNSLAQLKICDYPGVAQSLKTYRSRFRPKASKLMALIESADQKVVRSFIERMKEKRVTLRELGGEATELPRFITRDEILAHQIRIQARLEKEAKLAGELYAQSLSGGTGQVGFQASIERFRKSVEKRATQAKNATLSRVQRLAKDELGEIQRILDKLHIVEAELIQQLSLAERVVAANTDKIDIKKGTTGSQSPDRLTFPFEGEIWFDEVSNYKIDVKKGCQAKKKR